jgi:hypothetical protein
MDKIKEWTEIGKMMEALKKNAPKKSFLMDEIDMTIYEEVKDLYFRNILHIDETVNVNLSLDEDTEKALFTLANERQIPFDEIVNEALELLTNTCSGHDGYPEYEYRYLELGETLKEGDEFIENGSEYMPVIIYPCGLNVFTNTSCTVRRKIQVPTYRLLNYKERVEEGDEWLNTCSHEWIKTIWPFPPVFQIDKSATYRRKI